MSATGPWAEAYVKAISLASQMTLEEKVNMTGGTTSNTACAGFIPGVPRLGFPGMCVADAGQGIRMTDYVNAWPAGVAVGSSWNKDLAYKRANFLGREARGKGVNVLLGSAVGAIGRVVEGGRNWEAFSVDPYLSGELVYPSVLGTQDAGVITSTKHLLAAEQESHRLRYTVNSYSSNIDDKTIHELYLWPFYNAIRAGTGNIMCSLNRVNNSYACQNSKLLNGLLKGELGFQGFVISDWTGQQSGVASALAGLDLAMPNSNGYWGDNLTTAVTNGSVPEHQVDNKVIRMLASWFQMKQDRPDFPAPGHGLALDITGPHEVVDVRDPMAESVLLEGAAEGHVLVKNIDNALPLDSSKMKLISLFGYSAKAPDHNNQEEITAEHFLSRWNVGAESANMTEVLEYYYGDVIHPKSPIAQKGTLIAGGGSGATSQSYISAPYDALVTRARKDGTALFWDFESGNPRVNPTSNACLVIGNTWATETYDRPSLRDDFTDGLILNVASQCANTIVVFHNSGTHLVDVFVEHPNVTAIIYAHYPGQESGNALISLLYGDINPSGRLPYSVARNESDYGHLLEPDITLPPSRFQNFPQSDFTEGVFIDYRRFDAMNITPRYEFGYGLSYTSFEYSSLDISTTNSSRDPYPTGVIVEGGQEDPWDIIAMVSVTVTNIGGVDGKEVAQLHIGIPGKGEPSKQLRGFDKPIIKAKESVTVTFPLTRRDLSVWDVQAQQWKLQKGCYRILVGRSSSDLPLSGILHI